MMGFYRKLPVIIEAEQLRKDNAAELARWCGGALGSEPPEDDRSPVKDWALVVIIKTLEGEMVARQGDWIIRGVKGEFYPCKPDIFEMTYDTKNDVGVQP